jgi:DNA-binding NarL/FixJ family response regulator
MGEPSQIRVMIVDDQTLVREGLASLLSLTPDLEVVGKAGDGAEALALVECCKPDVVLMDVRMPGMNGVAALRHLRASHPHLRVLMLTTFDDDDYLFASLEAGAAGYLLKSIDPDQLAATIRAVHRGEIALDTGVTRRVVEAALHGGASAAAPLERLTARELEVLCLAAQGANNREIAELLVLTPGTVKNHLSHIFDKLGARDRIHALRLAQEWGLLGA